MVLVIELDARLDALLIERLQDHVPGAVGGVATASHWTFTVVARVATEATLINLSVWRAIEWKAHALQLNHCGDRFAREDLSRILVGQVVATLDGVEHVPLPVILFNIAKCGTDASLRRAGV